MKEFLHNTGPANERFSDLELTAHTSEASDTYMQVSALVKVSVCWTGLFSVLVL